MNSKSVKRAVLAGLLATGVLIALMYLAPIAGLPRVDMASAIGGFLAHPAELFSMRWWMGLFILILVGAILSPVIFLWLSTWLFGARWQRGMEWGVLLWAFGGVCVMFHFGLVFHEPFTVHPHVIALTTFVAHLVYGAVLGIVALRVLPPSPQIPGQPG